MPHCTVCRRTFPSRVGLALHTARTRNPACRVKKKAPTAHAEEASDSEDSEVDDISEDGLDEELGDDEADKPPQYFQGDYFGDSYMDADLPGWGSGEDEDIEMEGDDPNRPEDEPVESLSDNEDDFAEAAAANEQR